MEYGAELPISVSVEEPSTFDVFAPQKELRSNTWNTTTKSTHSTSAISPVKGTSNTASPMKAFSPNDKDMVIKFRYQVESRMKSTNPAVLKFEPNDIRLLPGTPIALENMRRRLIERHGILSFPALRFYLPQTEVSVEQLREAVKRLQIELSRAEFDQVNDIFKELLILYISQNFPLNSIDLFLFYDLGVASWSSFLAHHCDVC